MAPVHAPVNKKEDNKAYSAAFLRYYDLRSLP